MFGNAEIKEVLEVLGDGGENHRGNSLTFILIHNDKDPDIIMLGKDCNVGFNGTNVRLATVGAAVRSSCKGLF